LGRCFRKEVFYEGLYFHVFDDVYEPSEDTFLLAEKLDVNDGERVLDMGTGCGILAVLSAHKASRVLAVDVNPNAVKCARENARRNNVLEKIDFICGDLFNPIRREQLFDLILFNAPYLPVEEKPKEWVDYAWSGGENGRSVLDRFLNDASDYLKRGGRILIVQSSLSDINKTLLTLRKKGFKAEVTGEKSFFFEVIVLIKAVKS
jgi:release factor glutamine methyltransferase